jgi:hypothetical protein
LGTLVRRGGPERPAPPPLRPPGPLVILEEIKVGMTGIKDEHVRMDPDQHMGALYPFSLNQKLAVT